MIYRGSRGRMKGVRETVLLLCRKNYCGLRYILNMHDFFQNFFVMLMNAILSMCDTNYKTTRCTLCYNV